MARGNSTTRSQVAICWMSLIAAVLVGWFGIIQPIHNWRKAASTQMVELGRNIERFRNISEQAQTNNVPLEAELIKHYGGEFLNGENDAIILADMQTRIGELIARNQGQMTLASQLPGREIDGLSYLGMNVQLRGDIRDMFRIFHELETESPYLFVTKASLELSNGAALAAEEGEQIISVEANMEVFGARWPGGGQAQ